MFLENVSDILDQISVHFEAGEDPECYTEQYPKAFDQLASLFRMNTMVAECGFPIPGSYRRSAWAYLEGTTLRVVSRDELPNGGGLAEEFVLELTPVDTAQPPLWAYWCFAGAVVLLLIGFSIGVNALARDFFIDGSSTPTEVR